MKSRPRSNSELVYSTDGGMAKGAGTAGQKGPGRKGSDKNKKVSAAAAMPRDGVVRVGRETKGRKGKGVTIVHGAPLSGAELEALGKELKGLCGAGGTIKGDTVEIQGDHRDRIVGALENKGWTVKRVGG